MYAYENERDPQIKALAHSLRGQNDFETCQNIWSYLINKIDYKADASGTDGEMVRTPARLIYDGIGDCKSYSLFTAVVLRYLGIKHVFRFVSYSRRRDATHVYVVAYSGNNEIVIDAVSYEQLKTPFNQEIKYTYKCDMANGNTKISYLAGLPGTRTPQREPQSIGTVSDDVFSVWIGNENPADITPGKAWLYGKYDLLNEQLNISANAWQTAKLYNEISIIAALLIAYNDVNGDTNNFRAYVNIVCGMIQKDRFTSVSIDPDVRDRMFDSLVSEMKIKYNANIQPEKINQSWYYRILNNVIIANRTPDTTGISGIGAFTPLADMLKKVGIYFIYLFIPVNELKNYPASVAKKRTTQSFYYMVIHEVDIFHNAETVLDFFRSGIIARTGMQPEAYIQKIKTENVKSIGLAEWIITATAILGLLMGLIELIKAIFPNSKAADYAASSGVADLEKELFSLKQKNIDLEEKTKSNILQSSSTWLIAALGLGTLFFNKKKL